MQNIEKIALSQLMPALKAETEKLIEERDHRESTTILQSIETLNLRLSHQGELMQKGFEMTEKRLEAMDKCFEDMNKCFNGMQWMIGIGFTAIVTLIALLRFFIPFQAT